MSSTDAGPGGIAQGVSQDLVAAQTTLTDRSTPVEGSAEAPGTTGEVSKNAAKKAAKQAKLAAEKAEKAKGPKPIGHSEAKQPTSTKEKQSKSKKIEDAKLIGIDIAKETDFSAWYQQVLTKGEMLDYYDVSGCYILKESRPAFPLMPYN